MFRTVIAITGFTLGIVATTAMLVLAAELSVLIEGDAKLIFVLFLFELLPILFLTRLVLGVTRRD